MHVLSLHFKIAVLFPQINMLSKNLCVICNAAILSWGQNIFQWVPERKWTIEQNNDCSLWQKKVPLTLHIDINAQQYGTVWIQIGFVIFNATKVLWIVQEVSSRVIKQQNYSHDNQILSH